MPVATQKLCGERLYWYVLFTRTSRKQKAEQLLKNDWVQRPLYLSFRAGADSKKSRTNKKKTETAASELMIQWQSSPSTLPYSGTFLIKNNMDR